MFDVTDHLDELRCWSTTRLRARREELVRVRRSRTEELTVVRVMDERGQIDVTVGLDGESARMVREKVETARALESLPSIAAAAHAGALSAEQLGAVVKVADEESDAEWAARAPNVTPGGSRTDGAGADEAHGRGRPGPSRGAVPADVA